MDKPTLSAEQNSGVSGQIQSARDALIAARKRIERPENWGKGMRGSGYGSRSFDTCCAAEAIEDLKCGYSVRYAAINYLKQAIRAKHLTTVVNWNDAKSRTHKQVLAAFDRAIELAGTANLAAGADASARPQS